MISWRYHLVSIVAVFLALGLGLLMGTALLNDRLVENLRAGNDALQRQNRELEQQLGSLSAFASQVLPFVTEDRLFAQDVVLVTHQDVDEGALSDATRALESSGAVITTTLTIQPRMTAPSPGEQRVLAEFLGIQGQTSPEQAAAVAAEALAERLATGPVVGSPESDDLLARFLSEGFVVAESDLNSTTGVGGEDQAIVFIAGDPAGSESTAGEELMPLVSEIAQLDVVIAVGEPTSSGAGLLSAVRRDVEAVGPLVTVDDLESPAGAAALILGLDRAIQTRQGGDYGVGEGAQQLLPSPA
jgi:Copper transport outer membrane protein, MctB